MGLGLFQVENTLNPSCIDLLRMSEVYVDGEKVVFEGDVPESPDDVFNLLMNVLSEQGRAVTGFVVDGEDALGEGNAPATYGRIDAATLSHDELTLQVIREFLAKMEPLGEELRSYSRNILIVGWSEVFKRMEEFIDKIKPFADLLDNLSPYANAYSPSWKDDFANYATEQADSLEKILSTFEAGDTAGLSDEVSLTLVPLFDRCCKFLREVVAPDLESSISEAK